MAQCISAAGGVVMLVLYFLPDLHRARRPTSSIPPTAVASAASSSQIAAFTNRDAIVERQASPVVDVGCAPRDAAVASDGRRAANAAPLEQHTADTPLAASGVRQKQLKAVRFELARNTWISPERGELDIGAQR